MFHRRPLAVHTQFRHAFLTNMELGSALRAGRHGQLRLAVQRWYFESRPQRSLAEGQWKSVDEQVGAIALEELVLGHPHHDFKIAPRCARLAGIAFAADEQSQSSIGPRWHCHRNHSLDLDPTAALAAWTRICNHRAGTV